MEQGAAPRSGTLRIAILFMLLVMALPASAQELRIRYKDVEGVWAPMEDIFDRPPDSPTSDCDLIAKELTLTIDDRAIYGKDFTCAVKHARVFDFQTKVLAYANCTIAGQSILRKYVLSRSDNVLHVALTEIDPGERKEVLSQTESIYRKVRCDTAR